MTGNFFNATFDGQSAIIGRASARPAAGAARRRQRLDRPEPGHGLHPRSRPGSSPIPASPIRPDARPAPRAARRDGRALRLGAPCAGPSRSAPARTATASRSSGRTSSCRDGPCSAPIDGTRDVRPTSAAAVRASGTGTRAGRPERLRASPRSGNARVRRLARVAAAGSTNVWLAVSDDGGRTSAAPVRVSANAPGAVEELHPSVAARTGEVVVAWQEFADAAQTTTAAASSLRASISTARSAAATCGVDDDRRRAASGCRPSRSPASARSWPGSTSATSGPTASRSSTSTPRAAANAARFEPDVRVDAGAPDRARRCISTTSGPRHRRRRRPGAPRLGRLPQLQLGHLLRPQRRRRADVGARTCGSTTSWRRAPATSARPSASARAARSTLPGPTCAPASPTRTSSMRAATDLGATFSHSAPARRLARGLRSEHATRPRTSGTPAWPPRATGSSSPGKTTALGNNDVFFARSADGGATFEPSERVDDTGRGQSEQTRPRLAWAAGRLLRGLGGRPQRHPRRVRRTSQLPCLEALS